MPLMRISPRHIIVLIRIARVTQARWLRRLLFWTGALLVAVAAILLASWANSAQDLYFWVIRQGAARGLGFFPAFVLTPLGLMLSLLLTRKVFPGAQGSGIPQAIAALRMQNPETIRAVLSLRIAVGKILLTLLGLACGASIGREGPTVQVGAALMFNIGFLLRNPERDLQRALILAGGAAGIAAAFNTPLAGVMFAVEELAGSFEARTSGTTLTAVIVAGIATLALVGNYTYFGSTSADLAIGPGWLAVLLCGVVGGGAGGLFAFTLLNFTAGLPGALGQWIARRPMLFAAGCGLLLALIAWASDGRTSGTGYAVARAVIEGRASVPWSYPFLKFAATVVSYISGIPGGIFAPSLSVGVGFGALLAPLVPSASPAAMALLGMVGYFAGAVQAPITAAVIVMEMTSNQAMTVPLLATAMVAFGVSRLICRRSLYGALADRFLEATRPRS